MPYFQLSIGPVKEFIATARRTKDLHSGSYILSMLATVGIRSTMEQGGTILLPDANEDNTKWILEGGGDPRTFPQFPNRFFAEVNNDFDPNKVVDHIKKTFKELAEKVWSIAFLDFRPYEKIGFKEKDTRDIWDRQVDNYLHIQWVITEDNNPSSLDQRKNVANYFAETEKGFKCMTMVGLQELSGNEDLNAERRNQFWEQVNEVHINNTSEKKGIFDVQSNKIQIEHLSAIAYIKRCFYEAFEQEVSINSIKFDGQSLHFKTPKYLQKIPSTDEMAKRSYSKKSTFYAILAMDGDKFGSFLHKKTVRDEIKTALNNYIPEVQKIVEGNNKEKEGLLIYCGGEDILAMLPLDRALETAKQLRDKFIDCFKDANEEAKKATEEKVELTISGAIVYTQYKMPLMQSINRANELLDSIAKEKTGRNALALEVNKPSGRLATWCLPWDNKTAGCDASIPTVLDGNKIILQSIIEDLKNNDNLKGKTAEKPENKEDEENLSDAENRKESFFSSKFLYRFRTTYRNLNNQLSDEDLIENLIFTDYYHSLGKVPAKQKNDKLNIVKDLIKQSKVVENQKLTEKISDAAAMIARFIATDGVVDRDNNEDEDKSKAKKQ